MSAVTFKNVNGARSGHESRYQISRSNLFWAIVLGWATTIGGVVALFALMAIRSQLDVMQTDKRPWLRAVVSLDRVRFSDWNGNKSIWLRPAVVVKNYGSSPAINTIVSDSVVLFSQETKTDINNRQPKLCVDATSKANANPVGGVAVFPGDESEKIVPLAFTINWPSNNSGAEFVVLGCINYTYANDRRGETGFRYLLSQTKDGVFVGIHFYEGQPEPYYRPPSADLLAHGFPVTPPNVSTVSEDQFYFKKQDSGNYAK